MTKLHPTEGDVKKAVKALLDKHGWFHWMPPANMYGASGQSDILALKRGVFLAIETKLKKKAGTVNQEDFMTAVRANGGLARLVNMDGLPVFAKMLQKIDDHYGWTAPE